MKTEKSKFSFNSLFAINLIVFLFLFVNSVFSNGQKTYDFKNGENLKASDLHIEFEGNTSFHTGGAGTDPTVEVPANTFKDGNFSTAPGANPSSANLATGTPGAGGTGVPAGSTVSLTFDYVGDTPPNIKTWYWTKSNNSSPSLIEADTLGKPKSPPKKCFQLVMAPATGNGALFISIGGVQFPITLTPGQSGAQNALSIVNYVNSLTHGIAAMTGPSSFFVASALNSGSPSDFSAGILQQDDTQTMAFSDCTFANAIPTLPEWGLILLGVLLFSLGIVYLRRIF